MLSKEVNLNKANHTGLVIGLDIIAINSHLRTRARDNGEMEQKAKELAEKAAICVAKSVCT